MNGLELSQGQEQAQLQEQLQELLILCEQDRQNAQEVREAIGRLRQWRVKIKHWLSGKKCTKSLPWRTHFVEQTKHSLYGR